MSTTNAQSATITRVADDAFVIGRDFAAPPHLVWRALTEPELVKRWWHANRSEVVSADIDLRVGGRWRYVSRMADGTEFAFSGEYSELDPDRRMVTTECFEPMGEDACSLNTVTLTTTDSGTRLETHVQHSDPEAAQGHLDSGMEAGMQDAYDRLEEVARELA